MRLILFSLIINFCSIAFAQKENLKLEDAILGRWDKFSTDKIQGLQWVKNNNEYSYIKDNILFIESLEGITRQLLLSNLNEYFGDDSLTSFPKINWIDKDKFRFKKQSSFYSYNISNQKLIKLLTIDKNAEHLDFSNHNLALSYTIKNNLFIQDSKGKTHKVTFDENPNIINGQAVHRYEFGISKGTFWSNDGNSLAFYRKDESMVTDYPLVNIDARVAEAKIIKYPMAGMNSHHVTLGIYNVKTGEKVFVNTGKPKEQYLTNIAWGPKDKFIYIAVLNRDQNHLKLNKYNATTGDFIKTLFEEKHEKYVQPLHPMIFVNENDNEFLWRSERDGYDHFYRYTVEGELLNQVTKGKWVVKNFIAFTGNSIIVTGTHNNALEVQIFKSPIKSSRSTIISKAEGVHRVQANYNGRF